MHVHRLSRVLSSACMREILPIGFRRRESNGAVYFFLFFCPRRGHLSDIVATWDGFTRGMDKAVGACCHVSVSGLASGMNRGAIYWICPAWPCLALLALLALLLLVLLVLLILDPLRMAEEGRGRGFVSNNMTGGGHAGLTGSPLLLEESVLERW